LLKNLTQSDPHGHPVPPVAASLLLYWTGLGEGLSTTDAVQLQRLTRVQQPPYTAYPQLVMNAIAFGAGTNDA
jgi:hypothetical protein